MSNRIPTEENLDNQQKDFLKNMKDNNFAGRNIWIKGFPGSGKSVLLIYAIKYLLNNKVTQNAKIVLVVFTHSLIEHCKAELAELNISNVRIVTMYEFLKTKRKYDYILCDEVQDLTSRILTAMKERAGSMLIVAGDSNQSIYCRDPQYQEPVVTPEQISQIIDCENWGLLYVYRLTRSVIAAIQRMMPSMDIFSAKRYMAKIDTQIRLCKAELKEQEVEYIMREAYRFVNRNQSCVILLPTKDKVLEFCNIVLRLEHKPVWEKWLDQYYEPYFKRLNDHLKENQVPIECVVNSYGSLLAAENDKHIVIMTYHGVKGLDFDNVYIPFANAELYIPGDSEIAQKLFMVAMSRSKNNLYITYTGTPLSYVSLFSSDSTICANISICNELHPHLSGDINIDF